MKKLLVSLAAIAFSLSASATVINYSGSGIWKKSTGGSGDYTVTSAVEHNGNSVKITKTFTYGGNTRNVTMVLKKMDDTFYEVFDANDQYIGSGYCFPMGGSIPSKPGLDGGKICHTDTNTDDGFVESSVEIRADVVHSMGSKTTIATGERIIWMDTEHAAK